MKSDNDFVRNILQNAVSSELCVMLDPSSLQQLQTVLASLLIISSLSAQVLTK